jgi:hypothetical protein
VLHCDISIHSYNVLWSYSSSLLHFNSFIMLFSYMHIMYFSHSSPITLLLSLHSFFPQTVSLLHWCHFSFWVEIPHMRENMQYLSFWVWYILFNIIHLFSFWWHNSTILYGWQSSIMYIDHIFFTDPSLMGNYTDFIT